MSRIFEKLVWFGLALAGFFCFAILPPLLAPPRGNSSAWPSDPNPYIEIDGRLYWLTYGFGAVSGLCIARGLGMKFPSRNLNRDETGVSGNG